MSAELLAPNELGERRFSGGCRTIRTSPDYFGRCLGALALTTEYFTWQGSRNLVIAPVAVVGLGVFCAIMVVVHIDGAFRRIQPWTETAEIAFWGAATLACVVFYPVA